MGTDDKLDAKADELTGNDKVQRLPQNLKSSLGLLGWADDKFGWGPVFSRVRHRMSKL